MDNGYIVSSYWPMYTKYTKQDKEKIDIKAFLSSVIWRIEDEFQDFEKNEKG